VAVSRRPFTSPRFDPRSVHVRCMVNKVVLKEVFLPALRLCPVRIIPPMFHIHSNLDVVHTRRINGRSLANLPKKRYSLGNRGAWIRKKVYFLAVSCRHLTAETRVRSQACTLKFVVDKVVFLRVLRFSPVSIIPLKFHTYLHLHAALTVRKNVQSPGTLQKSNFDRIC
jgi:hypothetical protein